MSGVHGVRGLVPIWITAPVRTLLSGLLGAALLMPVQHSAVDDDIGQTVDYRGLRRAARWNLSATVGDADMGLPKRTAKWAGPRRAHQFRGDHNPTYGRVTLTIDRSWVDVNPAVLGPGGRKRLQGVL
ncbi:hypothetical protein ACWGIU_26650 [Streptomyces sp. NPDC054840]